MNNHNVPTQKNHPHDCPLALSGHAWERGLPPAASRTSVARRGGAPVPSCGLHHEPAARPALGTA